RLRAGIELRRDEPPRWGANVRMKRPVCARTTNIQLTKDPKTTIIAHLSPALHAGGQRLEPARLHQWDVVGDCSSGPRFLIAARRRHGPRPCPEPARGCGRRAVERRRGGELVAG